MTEQSGIPLALPDFLGHWQIERVLQHDDGTRGRFSGRALWQAQAGGALYSETGTLHLPGSGAFHAERRYRWDADLNVFFEDGRFFHRVPPEGGQTEHWCDPDQYRVDYAFGDWPNWRVCWRVTGPRKAYSMVSDYRRAAA